MSTDKRNAFYKGMLAARNGKQLSDIPSHFGEGFSFWIVGHNEETARIQNAKADEELVSNMFM